MLAARFPEEAVFTAQLEEVGLTGQFSMEES